MTTFSFYGQSNSLCFSQFGMQQNSFSKFPTTVLSICDLLNWIPLLNGIKMIFRLTRRSFQLVKIPYLNETRSRGTILHDTFCTFLKDQSLFSNPTLSKQIQFSLESESIRSMWILPPTKEGDLSGIP